MKRNNNILFKHLTGALILAGTMAIVHAADVSGTWTWTVPDRNGGPDHTNTLTLKVDGSSLTGKVSTLNRKGKVIDTPIADGKVDGDAISFIVVHENKGNSNTNSFSGTVAADEITGKIGYTHDGNQQSRDWAAKRSTDTN
jgi:hypothetical protein